MRETDFSWLVTGSNPKTSTGSSSENSWNGVRDNGVQVQRVSCTRLSSSSQNGSEYIPTANWRELSGYISHIVQRTSSNNWLQATPGCASLFFLNRVPGAPEKL